MEIRKEKGLCYTCDDKWSFKNQCPNKHLMILQVEEDGIELEQPEPHDVIEPTAEEEQMELHLSINAFKGACVLGTIRFIWLIGGIIVQILVDGGSIDSFLQPRVAKFLNFQLNLLPHLKC